MFSVDREFEQGAAGSRCFCSIMSVGGAGGNWEDSKTEVTRWLGLESPKATHMSEDQCCLGAQQHREWGSPPQLFGMLAGFQESIPAFMT